MLVLLSPAKIQNFKPQQVLKEFTLPEFLDEAAELVALLRTYPKEKLAALLEINSGLATLNSDRFFNWELPFTPENAKQAVLLYDGEVFRGLGAGRFSPSDFDYAQSHLRILSGLYGILRPLDLIQPYRLEISTRLHNQHGVDLYAYWKTKITDKVAEAVSWSGQPEMVINLASNEYFKSIDWKRLSVPVVDIEFLEERNGEYRPIVIYTKKARGLMTSYIIRNRITEVDELKGFDEAGYWYHTNLSKKDKLVFVRG